MRVVGRVGGLLDHGPDFRIRHLKDERAIAVLEAVAKLAGWEPRPAPHRTRSGEGRGVAFVHYDNYSGYAAVAMQVKVERATGKVRVGRVRSRTTAAQIVNPDGLSNQIEGNVVQTISRTLIEEAVASTRRASPASTGRATRSSDSPSCRTRSTSR